MFSPTRFVENLTGIKLVENDGKTMTWKGNVIMGLIGGLLLVCSWDISNSSTLSPVSGTD